MGSQNAAPPRLADVRDFAAGHVTRPDTRTARTGTVTPIGTVTPTDTAPPAGIVRSSDTVRLSGTGRSAVRP